MVIFKFIKKKFYIIHTLDHIDLYIDIIFKKRLTQIVLLGLILDYTCQIHSHYVKLNISIAQQPELI